MVPCSREGPCCVSWSVVWWQVCRYRCIVSYESPEFQEFALCILQKHNCLENHATIPARPDPAPIASFRGQPLTHEMAEEVGPAPPAAGL